MTTCGTRSHYVAAKCRCVECTRANAEYQKQWARDREHPRLIVRSALIAKLERELYETASIEELLANESDIIERIRLRTELAYRQAWNERSRSLVSFLRGEQTNQCGEREEYAAIVHLATEEKEQILASERIEHEREQERQARERNRNRWAFEQDIEQDAITQAYERARSEGEAG